MRKNIRECCNWLDRSQIVELLEGNSIQCYDNESDDELRDALVECIENGDIDKSIIREMVE